MKILTEEDVKFKGSERYYSLKRDFNNISCLNILYNIHFKPSKKIGYVSELLKRLGPTTVEEAYEKYIESGNNERHLPLQERGRTYDELEEMAIKWKEMSHVDKPLVDFYDALVLHAVVETFDGNGMENIVRDAFIAAGFKTRRTNGKEDAEYGIDVVAEKGDQKFLVQVKPKTFYYPAPDNDTLLDDRKSMWEKEVKGKEAFGQDFIYQYYIYDKPKFGNSGWIINKKTGNCAFVYTDLVKKDSSDVAVNMWELSKHQSPEVLLKTE